MTIRQLLPGIQWLDNYRAATFKADLLSGITIGILLIPQGMGYAMVAGLPPQMGIYAAIFPPLIYALFGTSNKISIGPVALDSVLILAGLSALESVGSEEYCRLAVTLTLMVGLIQAALGALRFGVISNFLSYPVILGYTSAAALVIICSQLANFFAVPLDFGSVPAVLADAAQRYAQWNPVVLVYGLLAMIVLYIAGWLLPKFPMALTLMIASMLLLGMNPWLSEQLPVIQRIPEGIPLPLLPTINPDDLLKLLPTACTVALVGYVGSMSICKAVEGPADKHLAKPNQELIAVGLANLVGAMFRAFPVSASFSRSAAFRQAGAETQISAIFSALLVAIILLAFAPFFLDFPLPKVVLSAIIVISVMSQFKPRQMLAVGRADWKEGIILLAVFVITLLKGVQLGLAVGVILSVFLLVWAYSRPHMAQLGLIQEVGIYRNVERFEAAKIRDDAIIFRFDGPLFFANKDYFEERLYQWIGKRNNNAIRSVIFDAEATPSIDYSAIRMLEHTIERLESLHIRFYFAGLIGPVRDTLSASSLGNYCSTDHAFATVNDAIQFLDKGIHQNRILAMQTGLIHRAAATVVDNNRGQAQ